MALKWPTQILISLIITNNLVGQLLQRPNFRRYSSQFKIESVILVASFSQKVALIA
jgi:hypothetical protein